MEEHFADTHVLKVAPCSRDGGFGCFAASDLEPGTPLLPDGGEEAAVVGPAAAEACVGCCRIVERAAVEKYRCDFCGLTLCPKCREASNLEPLNDAASSRHGEEECRPMSKLGTVSAVGDDSYNLVFPLRMLLLRRRNEGLFGRLMELQSHAEEWGERGRKGGGGGGDRVGESFALMSAVLSELTGESAAVVREVLGIQHTNSFEMACRGSDSSSFAARVLFAGVPSRVNHSCVPNLQHDIVAEMPDSDSSGPRFVMQLKTRRRILAGQQLTIRYNSLLDDFVSRQTLFLNTWHFLCRCQRCRDPSEFGTYFSSERCPRCADKEGGGFAIVAGRKEEGDPTSSVLRKLRQAFSGHFRCGREQQQGQIEGGKLPPLLQETTSPFLAEFSRVSAPTLSKLVDAIRAAEEEGPLHGTHFRVAEAKWEVAKINIGLPGEGVSLPEEEEFFRVLGLQESFVRQRLELIQSLESSSGAAEKSPELEECLAVLIRVLLKKAEATRRRRSGPPPQREELVQILREMKDARAALEVLRRGRSR